MKNLLEIDYNFPCAIESIQFFFEKKKNHKRCPQSIMYGIQYKIQINMQFTTTERLKPNMFS